MAGQVERRMRFPPGTGRDAGRGESGIEVFPAGWPLSECGVDTAPRPPQTQVSQAKCFVLKIHYF